MALSLEFHRVTGRKGLYFVNSSWPGDAIWRHGTRSTLAHVMACCLTAPSHYLNQCWLIICEVPWHSSRCIIIRRSEETNQLNKIEYCSFKMASRSPRGHWVNLSKAGHVNIWDPNLVITTPADGLVYWYKLITSHTRVNTRVQSAPMRYLFLK